MELVGFAGFAGAILLFALAMVFMGVKVVPQGMEYTVERFGRYTSTLKPGLHFIVPVVDRVGAELRSFIMMASPTSYFIKFEVLS